jgi:hypothetical protein
MSHSPVESKNYVFILDLLMVSGYEPSISHSTSFLSIKFSSSNPEHISRSPIRCTDTSHKNISYLETLTE